MISEKYIMKLVKNYAKSNEGKAAIKAKYGITYEQRFDEKKATAYGEQMRNILFKHVNSVIKSITLDDIEVGDVEVDDSGKYSIKISFDKGSLHRESLRPDLYPDGLHNIVLLFERGYHAANAVKGEWHGQYISSRTDREPNSFLNDAVEEFNKLNGKIATATLEGVYKN